MTNSSPSKIWTREFLFVFLTQTAFSSAYCILIPTLPIYLSGIGSTEVEIGVVMGTLGMTSLVVRPIVGKALLRHCEKFFIFSGIVLFALGSAGYLLVSSFWLLLLMRSLQGVGTAFIFTSAVTRVANISPPNRLGQSLSYYYLAFNIALATIPTLGMFLINAYSFTMLFTVCVGISLCSLALSTRLGRRHTEWSDKADAKEGSLLSRKAIPTAIMALIDSMNYGAMMAFFPLYARSHGVSNPGPFFSAFAVMIISGRALGGKLLDLHRRERLILPCIVASTLAIVVLAFSRTLPMFVVVALVWGLGHAFLYPALAAYTLERAASSPGPAMGTFSAFDELGAGMGPILAGIILRMSSYSVMFLCLALAGILNMLYFYFLVRRR